MGCVRGRVGKDTDRTPMALDDLFSDGKSYASAVRFGGEVGQKDFIVKGRGYAGALVGDSDFPGIGGGKDREHNLTADGRGLDGVRQDGNERVLELGCVADNSGGDGLANENEGDIFGVGQGAMRIDDVRDEIERVYGGELDLEWAGGVEQV